MSNMTTTSHAEVHAMQVRYFELLRKREFQPLDYVPTEREAPIMYTHAEVCRDGVVRQYPSRALRCCPNPEDEAELDQLHSAIEAAGVRMYM